MASENICVVLTLSRPSSNWSMVDWYWKKICGIPFLLRNIFSLQRSGVNTLIIYSDSENTALRKKLSMENKLTVKLTFKTNITEVVRATKNHPTLILNGGALHTKQEIESGMNFTNQPDEELVYPINPSIMTETLNQIIMGNKVLLSPSSDDQESFINFLPGKNESQINKPKDFLIQHKNLLQSCGLSNDSFMDKTITRFFSRQLTRLFLKTPLSPNMITILSLFIGLISALFFLQGTHENSIIGAGLLLLSAWIDCTDGEVARLKFSESKIGGKLDILCDNLVHFSVFFAIGMGLYQSTENNIFMFFGLFAVFGSLVSFLILSSSIIDKKEKVSANTVDLKNKNTLTDNMANRDFIYFLFFMSLIGRVDVFICITAFGSNIFAIYLAYYKIKPLLHAS
ncbi:MAG: CDP-alcohol phosphatidyltransferase family protein [Nitrospina sp.]|nr:CDP-alcohol phosphatidyltransferase family protein [Nitrospina sp.]